LNEQSVRSPGAEELRQIDEQVGRQTRLLSAERTELGRLRQADVSVVASAHGNSKHNGKQ